MTDPLLTIEDATREFRMSPKTIRRRLVLLVERQITVPPSA